MLYDISKPFPDTMLYGGQNIALTLYFDRVLSFLKLSEDSSFSENDKLDIAFRWFIKRSLRLLFLTRAQKRDIAKIVLTDYLITNKKSFKRDNGKVLLDWEQDSGYIYASFAAVYGIDLFEQQGKMQWFKFYSLFQALPPDSYIKKIMEIRNKKIAYNGKNMKEIVQLQELQNYYSLDINTGGLGSNLQSGLSSLFRLMENKAKLSERR